MHDSLSRLGALPPQTAVYCGHEYTVANLRFALALEPGNRDAQLHFADCQGRRARGLPTLPSTIGLERRINPFLRTGEPQVRAAAESRAARSLPTEVDVFGEIRRWKDGFRG
jgi:hydroxyacylglutathione hydrolase